MFYLLHLVPVLIFMCVNTISISPEDGVHVLKGRGAAAPGVKPAPVELLDHLDKAAQNDADKSAGMLPFQVPTDRACAEMDRPSYAKATCTSYPGRIVCQLGRYTFVINNGEHKMNPEIIERFAAMVYHRSQEGDADFDVSVDIPLKINEDYFVPPQKFIETTTVKIEENRYPVFVECSPIPDDRKMCNPPYNPTEITYSCKRRELGFGGYSGGHGKRMVISVDREGTVSAGGLVLPYSALLERRKKRQKEKPVDKAELIHLTPSGTDNKLYSDVCSYQTKGWCPNFIGTECPPSCRTENQTVGNDCAAVNDAPPTSAIELLPAAEVPQAPSGGNAPSAVIQTQEKVQHAFPINLAREDDSLPLEKEDEAELYAVTILPPPQVRVYSDICLKSTEFPWCPQSIGEAVECSIPTCVTIDECAPPTTKCRQRREQPKEKNPAGPLPRHIQNRMRTGRKFGPKRIYRKRKRQARIASFHFQTPLAKKQGPRTTQGTLTTRSATQNKTSTNKKNMPQCTLAPECTTTPQCTIALECTTNTIPPECTTPLSSIPPECTTPLSSIPPECTTPQSSIPPECTVAPWCTSTSQTTITPECKTIQECQPIQEYTTLPCQTISLLISQSTKVYVGLQKLGFNRLPSFKREIRRRRKKPYHIQWPNVSKERFILE